MKIKMLEHYQDAGHILQPGQEVEIELELGEWLVKHHKAVALSMSFEEFMTPDIKENVTGVEKVVVGETEQPPEAKEGETTGEFGKLPDIDPENPVTEKSAKPKRRSKK